MSNIKSDNNNNNNSSSSSSSSSKANGSYQPPLTDPEVVPQAKRRQFSAAYKERILAEADACTEPGEIGALLRREGIYSSYLTSWRREREKRDRLEPQKRGRKGQSAQEQEIAHLRAENEHMRAQLERAETIIDVQKKVSQLFGLPTAETKESESK